MPGRSSSLAALLPSLSCRRDELPDDLRRLDFDLRLDRPERSLERFRLSWRVFRPELVRERRLELDRRLERLTTAIDRRLSRPERLRFCARPRSLWWDSERRRERERLRRQPIGFLGK